jgi:AraC family transcriptional regulator, positive regulator of tynA and feaB
VSDTTISLTTDGIRPHERPEFWTALVSRHVTPMAMEPSQLELRGEIQARSVGDLGLARVSGQGIRAIHSDAHAACATSHLYAACIHIEGDTTITQDGHTTSLRPGDVFITDSRRPFTLGLERPWRHLVLTLPTAYLDASVGHAEGIAGRVLRDAALVRLWASHLAAGFALVPELSRAAAALFARQSVDLLTELLNETLRAGPLVETNRAAAFVSACHVIAQRFREPDLKPETVAREIGVSGRTLARIFAERDETVMRRVFAERVTEAATLLASPAWAHRAITDIAFTCGFNDLSHFGRVFAAKMQITPSEYRLRALGT